MADARLRPPGLSPLAPSPLSRMPVQQAPARREPESPCQEGIHRRTRICARGTPAAQPQRFLFQQPPPGPPSCRQGQELLCIKKGCQESRSCVDASGRVRYD